MNTYDPLRQYLSNLPSSQSQVDLSFSDIEEIIRTPLPPSARNHRPWWGNERSSNMHTQCKAWIEAGWEVETVDLQGETVRFRRVRQDS